MKSLVLVLSAGLALSAAEPEASVDNAPTAPNPAAQPMPAVLPAQSGAAEALDLETAVSRALEANRRLGAARAGKAAALSGAKARTAFNRPQLNAAGTWRYADGVNNRYAALDNPTDAWSAGLSVQQLIYGFGTQGAAQRQAEADIASAEANLQLSERDIAYQARASVAELWFATERVTISQARSDLRQAEFEDAQRLFQAGRIAAIDVRQAEISAIQAAEELRGDSVAREQVRLELAQLLDAPLERITPGGRLTRPAQLDELDAQAAAAVEGNAEVRTIDAKRQAALADADYLRAANRPQLLAGAGYNWEGADPQDLDDGWRVDLTLSWRFDGGANSSRATAAMEQARAEEYLRAETVASNHTQLESIRVELASLEKRIQSQAQAVGLAESNYEDTRELYRAGRVTLTRVTEANLQLSQARFALAGLIYRELLLSFALVRLSE